MKIRINKSVRIPQLMTVRKVYINENKKECIMMDGEWWELNGYKDYLKDRFAINISYEFVEG